MHVGTSSTAVGIGIEMGVISEFAAAVGEDVEMIAVLGVGRLEVGMTTLTLKGAI